MSTFFYLQTCDTCRRIKHEIGEKPALSFREIKSQPLTAADIDRLAEKAGSFEAIFNKRSRQLQGSGIKASDLVETDFHRLLNEHYSYLKRPLLETDAEVVAGSSAKAVADMHRLT